MKKFCEVKVKREQQWNPWHGCTKISPGCLNCYVYRQDKQYGSQLISSKCHKNADFGLPVKRSRSGDYKIPSGSIVFTCFTSDFLLKDADEWRNECWRMIRERCDCMFYFFTKRIERFADCVPPDWNDGYDNVMVGCTVENQNRVDFRLPIFMSLPIKHKTIIVAPILEKINLSDYLTEKIEEVSVGGESGFNARQCNYDWILDIRSQCMDKNVPFRFHQTGANFVKDGRTYRIKRALQRPQALKANINFGIEERSFSESAVTDEYDELQMRFDID